MFFTSISTLIEKRGIIQGFLHFGITFSDVFSIDIFLEPADFKVDRLNTHSVQQTWHHFLYLQDANKLEYLDQGTYRFIHYNLIGESMDISDFSEAIFTLLPDSTIVWKNHSSGVIIEDITSSMLTKNDFSDVINTLESDLYTHLRLLNVVLPFRCFLPAY